MKYLALCAVASLIALASFGSSTLFAQQESLADPPNIVIILADDLGYGDIGAYGGEKIRTPNIDALAADGIRFTDAYASANVCTPARAGLLTGRYAIRSGLAWKVVDASSQHGLPAEEDTIAEIARRAGYRTMLIGKWHLGNLQDYSPLDHGFDEFFGVPHSNDMPNFALFDGRKKIDDAVDQSTLTRRYTDYAVRFVAEDDDRPFLLLLAHTFPHIPLYASPSFRGKSDAGIYGDTVEELDWSTGQIVDTLRRLNVEDNTLVLFSSDNGPFFEGSTGHHRGRKGDSWEGGFRVPFIVKWPDRIPKAQVSDSMVSLLDVLPTVSALVGEQSSATEVDGASLLPVFEDPRQRLHDYLFYFNNENIVGVRSQDWKYVTHTYYTGSLGAFEKFDQLPGFDESYDMLLGTDDESYSLADRHPEIVATMKRVLTKARAKFYPMRTRPSEQTYPE